MDMDKFVQKLSESPEFFELLKKATIEIQEEKPELQEHTTPNAHTVKRARVMEPAVDEGEWLLNNSQPAGDD